MGRKGIEPLDRDSSTDLSMRTDWLSRSSINCFFSSPLPCSLLYNNAKFWLLGGSQNFRLLSITLTNSQPINIRDNEIDAWYKRLRMLPCTVHDRNGFRVTANEENELHTRCSHFSTVRKRGTVTTVWPQITSQRLNPLIWASLEKHSFLTFATRVRTLTVILRSLFLFFFSSRR